MTNKEKYKRAFSALHTSNEFSLEVEKMKNTSKKLNKWVASLAICVLAFGGATIAYAADIGGIQSTIKLWIYGEKTDVVIEFDGGGNYKMNYIDNEGNYKERSGGGVAYDENGERPLTEEEIMEELMTTPEVVYNEDGSVWIYWFNQKTDITDKFEDGICYVELVNGDETLYMTIEYQKGHASSSTEYVSLN